MKMYQSAMIACLVIVLFAFSYKSLEYNCNAHPTGKECPGVFIGGSIWEIKNNSSGADYRVTVRKSWQSGTKQGSSDAVYTLHAGESKELGCNKIEGGPGQYPTYITWMVVGEVRLGPSPSPSPGPSPKPNDNGAKVLRFKKRGFLFDYSNQAGGTGGNTFELSPPADYKRVRSIIVSSDKYVEGLQVEWDMKDGSISKSPKVGSFSKTTERVIDFAQGEYITGFEGRCGMWIDYLTIQTNMKEYKFGGSGGSVFYFHRVAECSGKDDGVEIVGFTGRSGLYIDALGIIGKCRQ